VFAELRAKYEEIRALRLTDDGSYDPRERMATLAARFPGALREIDTLPLDEIERRIEALTQAERDPSSAPKWMLAQHRFHTLTRDALSTRRNPAGSEGAQSPLAEARGASATSAEGELEGAALEREKERQKLMARVYATLAKELATTPHEAKALVFSLSSRERA
jgi:hypothetical protein